MRGAVAGLPGPAEPAARRRVIAYDRLGFGRSGPRTDRPPLRFVSEEAEVYFPVRRHPELIGERCGGPLRVAILADTGHVPHRERTASVLELVTGFLDE